MYVAKRERRVRVRRRRRDERHDDSGVGQLAVSVTVNPARARVYVPEFGANSVPVIQ